MTRFRLPLLVCALGLLAGCGGSTPSAAPADMGGEDGTRIATLIEDINDVKGGGRKFAAVFAKGATPAAGEAKKYMPYEFTIVGKPTVGGAEATAKVAVKRDGTGADVGQKEWTFVKEGDAWKINSAPLP
jgi:hypothetical protein